MHTLITGSPGVGKSTLIRRVLTQLHVPVSGFETKKGSPLPGMEGHPVYLQAAEGGQPLLAGRADRRILEVRTEAFDRFAPHLLHPAPPGSIILMDELGIMESRSPAFCAAVLHLLDGDTPVIAAVKPKDTPFLTAIRSHPKARLFHLTPENREDLFPEVLSFVRQQLSGGNL